MEGSNTNGKKDKPIINITEVLKSPYLREEEAAAVTKKALSTLRNERFLCRGIPYLKIGARSIRYRTSDVLAYMENRRICFDDSPGE